MPLPSEPISKGRPCTPWPRSFTFPDRLWVDPPDLTVKVWAVKMIRNLMAPIELRDGTTIPQVVQQAQDVFGSVPSPNIEPLTFQSQRLLALIDQKLMMHRPKPKPKPKPQAAAHSRPQAAPNQLGPKPKPKPGPQPPPHVIQRPPVGLPAKRNALDISDFLGDA